MCARGMRAIHVVEQWLRARNAMAKLSHSMHLHRASISLPTNLRLFSHPQQLPTRISTFLTPLRPHRQAKQDLAHRGTEFSPQTTACRAKRLLRVLLAVGRIILPTVYLYPHENIVWYCPQFATVHGTIYSRLNLLITTASSKEAHHALTMNR